MSDPILSPERCAAIRAQLAQHAHQIHEQAERCRAENEQFERENPPAPGEELGPCHTCGYETQLADLMLEAATALAAYDQITLERDRLIAAAAEAIEAIDVMTTEQQKGWTDNLGALVTLGQIRKVRAALAGDGGSTT